MSYSLLALPRFQKDVKKLAKRYPSIKDDLKVLFEQLENHPFQGTSLGNSCYKIRVPIASKGKGKSGGGRLITYVAIQDSIVYLMTMYDKSEKATITNQEISQILSQIQGQ